MARIRIPQRYRTGLKHILEVTDEEFHNLVDALDNVEISLISAQDVDQLIPHAIVMPRATATAIMDTVFSMSMTAIFNDVSTQQFARDVVDALEREPIKDIPMTAETLTLLTERLNALLEIDLVKVGMNATGILYEHQHAFSRARILTDIRPIFSDDVADAPVGMLLVHTLKLEYRESGQDKEFFVALDTRDLQELMNVIDRARTKEEGLKALLSSADIRFIDYVEDKS